VPASENTKNAEKKEDVPVANEPTRPSAIIKLKSKSGSKTDIDS
jgi:hypothetical protein